MYRRNRSHPALREMALGTEDLSTWMPVWITLRNSAMVLAVAEVLLRRATRDSMAAMGMVRSGSESSVRV